VALPQAPQPQSGQIPITVNTTRVLGNGIVESYADASKTSEWYSEKNNRTLLSCTLKQGSGSGKAVLHGDVL
jgi:hypothetical protein